MEQLVILLLQFRTALHVLHLRSQNYAEHVALGELYDQIGDLTDSIAEAYQGSEGRLLKIESLPAISLPEGEHTALEYVSDACGSIEQICKNAGSDLTDNPAVTNVLDDLTTALATAKYKLRFLR